MLCEYQETCLLKTPESCKPPQLELPKLSMAFLFSQWIATPNALLATPSAFQIPHSSIRGLYSDKLHYFIDQLIQVYVV